MLNEISRKPYERQLYEARRKAMLDYNNDMREAREKGKVQVLIEQGTSKFGKLPPWAEDKLRRATTEQIQQWGKAILLADNLEEWLKE